MLTQFVVQDTHQNALPNSRASCLVWVAFRMNGTPRTFRITPQDGENSTTVLLIVLEGIHQLLADGLTALMSRRGVQNFMNGLSWRSLPLKPHQPHLWTGNLDDAYVVLDAELKEGFVECRIGGGSGIAGILIEDAFDDCDESSTSLVAGSEAQCIGDCAAKR
ncbi:MAG: hypothetical protein ABTS22_03840 [Accumulibacter sp.]|uniref:hypothetical protein n=1 Tax=Accumulibacter sp. TaxID=2053492 RepID=UPI003315BD29